MQKFNARLPKTVVQLDFEEGQVESLDTEIEEARDNIKKWLREKRVRVSRIKKLRAMGLDTVNMTPEQHVESHKLTCAELGIAPDPEFLAMLGRPDTPVAPVKLVKTETPAERSERLMQEHEAAMGPLKPH